MSAPTQSRWCPTCQVNWPNTLQNPVCWICGAASQFSHDAPTHDHGPQAMAYAFAEKARRAKYAEFKAYDDQRTWWLLEYEGRSLATLAEAALPADRDEHLAAQFAMISQDAGQ